MSSKAPRNKSTSIEGKPAAVSRSDSDTPTMESLLSVNANGLPKWAEDIMAQKDRLDDPPPLSTLSGVELRSKLSELHCSLARHLTDQLDEIAQELSSLSDAALGHIESIKLGSVVSNCFRILEKKSRLDGEKGKEAINNLVELTRLGCNALTRASKDEKSENLLKSCASTLQKWPTMLSLTKTSFDEARTYLDRIGVGTRSFPPTAKTRINATNDWTKIAVKLIHKIINSRNTLEIEAQKEKSFSRMFGGLLLGIKEEEDPFYADRLAEARRWKQVLDLPALNLKTWQEWWIVAQAMLITDWEANPIEEAKLFKLVKQSAIKKLKAYQDTVSRTNPERYLKTASRNMVLTSIQEAFKRIAAKRLPTDG